MKTAGPLLFFVDISRVEYCFINITSSTQMNHCMFMKEHFLALVSYVVLVQERALVSKEMHVKAVIEAELGKVKMKYISVYRHRI
jgi:hypothetical protein